MLLWLYLEHHLSKVVEHFYPHVTTCFQHRVDKSSSCLGGLRMTSLPPPVFPRESRDLEIRAARNRACERAPFSRKATGGVCVAAPYLE